MVKLCKRGPKLDHQIRLAVEHDKGIPSMGIPEVRTRREVLSVKGTKAQKKIGFSVSICTILVCSFILLYICTNCCTLALQFFNFPLYNKVIHMNLQVLKNAFGETAPQTQDPSTCIMIVQKLI